MSKLTIPVILVATIMIAGMFAFMPVEQASTVHTTIGTGASTVLVATLDAVDEGDDIYGVASDGVDISDADSITIQVVIDGGAFLADDCDLELTVTDVTAGVDFDADILFADALIYDASGQADPVAGDTVVTNIDISVGAYNTIDIILDLDDGGGGTCNADSDYDLTLNVLKKGNNLP